MAETWKNILSLISNLFLIILLACNYGHYDNCSKPIQEWYMAFLSAGLIFQICSMLLNLFSNNVIIFSILIIIVGPISFAYYFAWNIVGTVYVSKIQGSEKPTDCMKTWETVLVLIFQSFLYLIYLMVFCAFYVFFKMYQAMQRRENDTKKTLVEIYIKVTESSMDTNTEAMIQICKDIQELMRDQKDILEKLKLMEEEKTVMRLFFIPEMINNMDQLSIHRESIASRQNQEPQGENTLTQPLLQMIENRFEDPRIQHRISQIQQTANPDKQECIICFDDLDDKSKTIILRCGHKFHDSCIFEWLVVNPTCPMCRHFFRIGLLKSILEHFTKKLENQGIKVENNFESIDELIPNDENA